MALFITYVFIGLAIAMPVGPITVEMTKQGLKNGFLHGWVVGLGGMTIDFLLIVALYFGLASLLQISFVQIPMWLLGALFLLFIAYDSIKNANKNITLFGEKPTKSLASSYRNGLFVAVSPGNIVFWISVFGAVLSNAYQTTNTDNFFIIAVGVLLGILLHDLGLLTIVSTTRKVMNRSLIKWFSVIAGMILLVFAGYFIYQFIIALIALR